MQIRVQKDAGAQRIAHTNWTESKLNGAVIKPALNDIADVLIGTLVKTFSGPIRYRGDMASGFGKTSIDDSSVGITQSARHEKFIREGTSGPYSGFPAPVVTWAMEKAHKSEREAFAIAYSIMREGTADTFVGLYPEGERRFEYTEWVVEKEHKDDLNDWAKAIGGGIVSYMVKGDVWRSVKLG